uniref:Uncharacterized protein n=1 Tax=Oryza punctata TaxID=4537 RepID=A0A0E0K8H1_ORYPU
MLVGGRDTRDGELEMVQGCVLRPIVPAAAALDLAWLRLLLPLYTQTSMGISHTFGFFLPNVLLRTEAKERREESGPAWDVS